MLRIYISTNASIKNDMRGKEEIKKKSANKTKQKPKKRR